MNRWCWPGVECPVHLTRDKAAPERLCSPVTALLLIGCQAGSFLQGDSGQFREAQSGPGGKRQGN